MIRNSNETAAFFPFLGAWVSRTAGHLSTRDRLIEWPTCALRWLSYVQYCCVLRNSKHDPSSGRVVPVGNQKTASLVARGSKSSHTSAQTHSSKPASLLCYSIVETNQFFYLSHKMSEWDAPKVDLDHPDSAIRLASAVHRFKVPKMNEDRKLSFARR